MIEVFRRIVKFILSETKTWGGLLSFIFTFFILFTAITNAVYGIFDFRMLPIFENSLSDLRHFIHALFEFILYRPIGWIGNYFASLVLPDFVLPDFRPPEWYADVVLISMILSRAERAAMKMASPVAHTSDDDGMYSRLETASWYLVLTFYVPTKAFLKPLRKWAPAKIHEAARILLDGVTWLGVWFLIHDIMLARTNWRSPRERDVSHRAFVFYLVISLLTVLVAVALFFIMNGFLHDKYQNGPSLD